MVNYAGRNIIYTFKYGGYATKKEKTILIIVPVGLAILGLAVFTILFLYNEPGAWVGLLLSFLGLVFLVTYLCLFLKTHKHDKEISIWLNDDNLFETKTIPWEFSNKLIGYGTYYKFGIDFNMNGESYRKVSLAYDAFYKCIKNKSITVLYSPKYDEVMILKG